MLKLLLPNQLELAENNVWSSPETVLALVEKLLADYPALKGYESRLRLSSWNAEYLWQHKSAYFINAYRQIIKRHHILALQEVSAPALSYLSAICDYKYVVSSANSRGQAVGFLIHPRFQVVHTQEYQQLTQVYGVHDLRPALQIDLFDPQTQSSLTLITLHLKSMLGDPFFTRLVRTKQLENLMAVINQSAPCIILGDFNCLLASSDNTSSLLNNGFVLSDPSNQDCTQSQGGRLDGLFHKNLPPHSALANYTVHNFWQFGSAGRSLSDHGLLNWVLTVN